MNVSNSLSYMRVEECFVVTGRGVVATGRVERGPFKVGDDVLWKKDGITKHASIVGIEKFRQLLDEAQPSEEIGMLLGGITRDEIDSECIIYLNE